MLKFTTTILGAAIISLNVNAQIPHYNYNRAPLLSDAYVQLPLGSIKPKGWLLKQLELQRDGAAGHAEELYPEPDNLGKETDWIGGKTASWEKVPYYVKGLVALAYTLNDDTLKARAAKWINWTLDNQQQSGVFGPPAMKDWWPRMPMMYAIQSYYEATGDKRVIPFLTKYFHYQLKNLDSQPFVDWGKARAADNLEIVLWLYNITGDDALMQLAQKIKLQAYQWQNIMPGNQYFYFGDDFYPKHAVNVGQALKFPAVCAQLDDALVFKTAFTNGMARIMDEHGLANGSTSGTEMLAGKSSLQGTETCTVVEWMQSYETAARIIHDAGIGDQLEKLAFNALPAQFDREQKLHSYYTSPNQVNCKIKPTGFNQDYDNAFLLTPYSGYPCCRFNMHMGWPYFVKNSWASTPQKGLAVIAYAPMTVNAYVADNVPVQIEETTDYPFGDRIVLKISVKKATKFPLTLRIPAWCKNPQVKVNGKIQKEVKAGILLDINRVWSNKDEVVLNFPMSIATTPRLNNSLSIERGPLVYALNIDVKDSVLKTHKVAGFADHQLLPASAWNYGLVIDMAALQNSFKVHTSAMPANPFDRTVTPVRLTTKAKKIPQWTYAVNDLYANEVPVSPVYSARELETVSLVPYGSENLRIAHFPVIGEPAIDASTFTDNFSSGSLKNWNWYGGDWFIKDGAINCGANKNGTKIVVNATTFSDFEYTATIKLTSKSNAGVLFRVTNPSLGADAYEGYYAAIDASNGNVLLGLADGKQWVPLRSVAQNITADKSYTIKIKAAGNKIAIYIDNSAEPLISYIDNKYKRGFVGLRAYDCKATFDNLAITAIK